MRRARITYHGAFHHAMNRGHDGLKIFQKEEDKEFFLRLLGEISRSLKTRILVYCLMVNHYHLVLENTSSRMSDFFKQLNGQFGSYYRKKNKGRGYVFQDRYKSMLIQDDSYLLMVIGYVLNNPVRAALVDNFLEYKWSSAHLYYKKASSKIVDNNFVEDLFGSNNNLINIIRTLDIQKLPTIQTRVGKIIGGEEFTIKAIENFNRRSSKKESLESKRIDDYCFDPVEKVFHEFKNIHGIDAYDIDTKSYSGKRQRGELLVYLKEKAGLKYSEIKKIPIFSDVKLFSLGKLYKNAKERIGGKNK
jgi:REP element-mobilizing transposase RayT